MGTRLVSSMAVLGVLAGCGGQPPGRCLSPPRVLEGMCVVRGVSLRDGQSLVELRLDGPAQPPFAISVWRSADELDELQGMVGLRFHCRAIDRGPCPPQSIVDLPPPAPPL